MIQVGDGCDVRLVQMCLNEAVVSLLIQQTYSI